MNQFYHLFFINPQSHFMDPGAVAFVPGWILLFMIILSVAMFRPKLFNSSAKKESGQNIINPYFIAFIIGSLMPLWDDILAFVFGPPFAHHSLFHSFFGATITYIAFRIISTKEIAKYALFGNLTHIFFNFYLDYVTLFFPLTYQEFGLTDLIKVSTYAIKVVHYPLILLFFIISTIKFFYKLKNTSKS